MEWFSDWWAALDVVRQILYCVAIPATLLLIIQSILIIIGFGGASEGVDFSDTSAFDGFDGDVGEGAGAGNLDGGAPGDFRVMGLFSFQGIVAFFCVFGWSGILFMDAFENVALALLLAFVLGFFAMYGVAKIIRFSGKLTQSGTLNMKTLIGETGTVYISIPEDKTKRGKVTVLMSERQVECDAISESGPLTINTPVRVTDILAGNVLVVEKLDA
ncbi:MAG: NfeD family protein [Oscillospiraceae bacterium]|nr:NfeD family protein [Oscillospiraceae bacterium]